MITATVCCERSWEGCFLGARGARSAEVACTVERELARGRALPTVFATPLALLRLFTMKKLLPPLLFALCAASMFATQRLPGSEALPAVARPAGFAAILAGLILLAVARLQFARAKTNILTFDEPGQLVTGGAFRVSRHPMYLGFALVLVGLALTLRSLPALCIAAGFVLIADRWYIAFEERWLRVKFGEAYEAYARRTRRWLG